MENIVIRQILIVAGVVFAASAAYAEERAATASETCTSIEQTCVATCIVPRLDETCQQECGRYSNTCHRTGTWQGRRWTITGVVRR